MTMTTMVMMFSFPVILFYGIPGSIISDKIGGYLSNKAKGSRLVVFTSATLHIIFGLVLLWVSLVAAILYFIVDRLIGNLNKTLGWKEAIKSLAIPMIIFSYILWISLDK